MSSVERSDCFPKPHSRGSFFCFFFLLLVKFSLFCLSSVRVRVSAKRRRLVAFHIIYGLPDPTAQLSVRVVVRVRARAQLSNSRSFQRRCHPPLPSGSRRRRRRRRRHLFPINTASSSSSTNRPHVGKETSRHRSVAALIRCDFIGRDLRPY